MIKFQNFQERYPNVHSPDFVTYNRIVKSIRDYIKNMKSDTTNTELFSLNSMGSFIAQQQIDKRILGLFRQYTSKSYIKMEPRVSQPWLGEYFQSVP